MRIKTQDYSDVTVVELQGELDSESCGLLQNTISGLISTHFSTKSKKKNSAASHKDGIVIDMSNVGFIDSAGLEQLLLVRDSCVANKCQLRLAGLDENCSKILEVTRLQNEFDCYEELALAVKSFV